MYVIYVCIVYTYVCMEIHMSIRECKEENIMCLPVSLLILSRQGILLNVELSWQSQAPSNPLVATPYIIGVTGICSKPSICHGCWGFELISSWLLSKHP